MTTNGNQGSIAANSSGKVEPFGVRLVAPVNRFGPLCVGLDPSPEVLAAWSQPNTAGGLERFVAEVVPQLTGRVGIVKPQTLFFERFGSAGFAILESTVAVLREAKVIVILDAKRSDVGSSMEGYADAYFGHGPLRVDALTVNPFMGLGTLEPIVRKAREAAGGLFVLARTSNPEAPLLQNSKTPSGQRVFEEVYAAVRVWNHMPGLERSIGVVVGATLEDARAGLEDLNAPVLAPGIGHQGAAPQGIQRTFGGATPHVIPSAPIVAVTSTRRIVSMAH